MLLNQIKQDIDPFRWCEARIVLLIGTVGICQAREDLNDSFHTVMLAWFRVRGERQSRRTGGTPNAGVVRLSFPPARAAC